MLLDRLFECEPTKTRILQAAEEVMKTTDFSHMSVVGICKQAGVSSPTFYRHFKDKYDIAQWLFEALMDDALFQIGRTLTWHQGHYRQAASVYEYRELFEGFMGEVSGYQSLPEFGVRRYGDELRRTLSELKGIKVTEELDFQIQCVAHFESSAAID